MRAAFLGIDVVRKGKQVFSVAVVVLKRDLQHHFRFFNLHINGLVQRRFGFVQMLDERDDSALVLEYLLFDRLFPLVLERDLESLIQKGELTKPLRQHVEAEVERLEDLPI